MELTDEAQQYADWLAKREGQFKKGEGPVDAWSGLAATGGKRDDKHMAKAARISVMTVRRARGKLHRIEEPAYRRYIEALNGSWEHFKELCKH